MIIKKFHEHLVSSDDIIKKAIIKLQKLKIKICLVVDRNKKYIGTLTDGDIRRGLLLNFTIQDKIKDVCNKKSVFIKKKLKEGKIKKILALKKISFFPIINKSKKVIGVYHFIDDNNLEIIKNEMLIMAGGKGKRLRPFTKKIPKPLLPVNGVPIIERIITTAKKQGIKSSRRRKLCFAMPD